MLNKRRVYSLMIMSTIFYTFNGVIDFMVIKALGVGLTAFFIGIGMLLGVIFSLYIFRMRLKLKKPSYYAFSAVSALFIVFYNVLLFLAYVKYTLASIYPLIGLSALIFLIIDILKYKSKLSGALIVVMILAVVLIVFGVFFAESSGFSFHTSTLPFVLGISVFAGVGYYMEFYKIKKYSVGSKILLQPLFLVIIAIFLVNHIPIVSKVNYLFIALGIIGGMLFILASTFELRAMKISNTASVRKTVINRNLINDFEYADTLLVLLGSVLIGSFTYEQIFGGVLIVAGIVLLSSAK
ncbi:MAG: hypothetical protein ACP5RM_02430 [Candidatus Micrarchaeia archaeon]